MKFDPKYIASILSIYLILYMSFYACKREDKVVLLKSKKTTLEFIQQKVDYTIFYHALIKTHQDTLLIGNTNYTVLVPSDKAFILAGISNAKSLDSIPDTTLLKLIRYHILPKTILYRDIPIQLDAVYNSITNQKLYFSKALNGRSTLFINGISIFGGVLGFEVDNGIIYELSQVLSVPNITLKDYLLKTPKYSILTEGLRNFGLLDSLALSTPYTVFAPSNEAFLVNKFTLDYIKGLDPAKFKKILFGIYLLRNTQIFLSDINIATNTPGLYSNEGLGAATVFYPPDLTFSINQSSIFNRLPPLGVYRDKFLRYNQADTYDDGSGPTFNTSENSSDGFTYNIVNKLCTNGVILEISFPLINPDSARIQ